MSLNPRRWLARHPAILPAAVHAGLCSAHLYFLLPSPLLRYLTVDLEAYDLWARELAGGHWLGQGVFYQDPLYPYLMGMVYALSGANVSHVLVIQVLCSAVTVGLVHRLASGLFDPRAGQLAAWLAAVYAPAVYYACKPEKACISMFALSLGLNWLFDARRRPSVLRWSRAGATLGLASLLRANVLLLVGFGLGLLAFTNALTVGRTARARAAAGLVLGLSLVLLPVLVRNGVVGGDWILTTSQGGPNLYIGNNPENLNGSYMAPSFVRPSPRYEQEDFHRHAEHALGRKLLPSEASAFYVREVFFWAASDPVSFARLQAIKAQAFVNAYEIPDNWSLDFVRRYSPVLALPLLSFGLLLPPAALGTALVLFRGRRSREQLLFVSLTLFYAASVIAFYIFSRYRFPIVFALQILAAHAVLELAGWTRAGRWKALLGGGLLVLVSGALCHAPPRIDRDSELSHRHFNLAASYFTDGRFDEAEAHCREALELEPSNGLALFTLSRIAGLRGDLERERHLLLQAFQVRPGDEGIQVRMTWLNARQSGLAEAERFAASLLRGRESYLLRRALVEIALEQRDPAAARSHLEWLLDRFPDDSWALARRRESAAGAVELPTASPSSERTRRLLDQVQALAASRRFEQAIGLLETRIHQGIQDPALFQHLSNLHYLAGDLRRARDALARALELDPENPLYKSNLRALDRRLGSP
jgi:tetratricopeptide (TPR) repeat protein